MEVLAMRVGWHVGWMNPPDLHMLLSEEPPPAEIWRRIPEPSGGNYFLCRQAPVVRFVYEDKRGGGALGRTVTLEDGETYKMNGGWSSSAGQINRLRALDPAFAEYLPEDIVEITFYGRYAHKDTYNDGWGLGMAGVAFDLSWVQEQVAKHLPGVELLDANVRDDSARDENQASSEQALIVGGRISYGYLPAAVDREETSPQGIKADIDSELFQRTAMAWDRKRASERSHHA